VSSIGASLGLEKATNARDLGGYRTIDGRYVRTGQLYRANALNRLSEADVKVLAGLRLACVVDFRHDREIELLGADRLPTPPPARLIALPLFDPDHDVATNINVVLRGKADQTALAVLHPDHAGGGAVVLMHQLYQRFVTSAEIRRSLAAALRLIADPDALPLLFHCTAGKDRAGWLAAVVLHILGVDRPTIVADYLRTNELNASGRDYVITTMAARVDDTSVVLPMLEAREEYLLAAFDQADVSYGGMAGYVRDGLALEPAVLAAIRANLLTD
jgi:protein-tyrosine phosphatase